MFYLITEKSAPCVRQSAYINYCFDLPLISKYLTIVCCVDVTFKPSISRVTQVFVKNYIYDAEQ